MLRSEPTAEIWEAVMNYARSHGDVDLGDQAEEIYLISLMLSACSRVRVRNPTLYKDEEKFRAANKEQSYVLDVLHDIDQEA
ncbi:hypothetical protein HanPI659440_Chr14g0553101 [Helianthus annuus]|nr:hypothetical protein HanIR_Chr14g0698561 [Helianthus annuus]KAJ0703616.1 hypothetical protein HanPI659440_Chr14g0553101 [Helianthus annuus]